MTLLLDKNNVVIGRFLRPITTSRTVVQLGLDGPINSYHPEALMNEQQIRSVVLERVEWEDSVFVRISGETPTDLFRHKGFKAWDG